MIKEVTLLSKDEAMGSIEVMKKVGGASTGTYWTKTPSREKKWICPSEFRIDMTGIADGGYITGSYGVRPVLKVENLDELIDSKSKTQNGIEEVSLGEYPHFDFELDLPQEEISKTGKIYHIKSEYSSNIEICEEYQTNEIKFITFNGKRYLVKPVQFYVDRNNSLLISKNVLFYSTINNNKEDSQTFASSKLYEFLNNEFIHDLTPKALNKVSSKVKIKTLF